jgi:hypothetical protein
MFVPLGIGFVLLAAQLQGCKFGTEGLDNVPDSAVVDAAVDAAGEGGVGCTPGTFRCNETIPAQIDECNADREWQFKRTCQYFCNPDGVICGDLNFRHQIQTPNFIRNVNTVPLNLQAADYVIDTDNGTDPISGPGAPAPGTYYIKELVRVDLPWLLILTFESIDIPDGCRITVTGSRPLALLSKGDVTIAGTIDATAVGSTAGPGGYDGGTDGFPGDGQGGGGAGGSFLQFQESGGGGGGHAEPGGAGGDTAGAAGGVAGAKVENDELVTLIGGSGGGSGGTADASAIPGAGGGGGGAIMVGSLTSIAIAITGGINVGGGGGQGGTTEEAGGGGGSGGAILLSAPTIAVSGTLAANGGGGGGADNGVPLDGEDGQLGNQAAPPGQFGGAGGAGTSIHGNPGTNSGNTHGGGGGGACGLIRIEHLMSPEPTFPGAVISPDPATDAFVLARIVFQ